MAGHRGQAGKAIRKSMKTKGGQSLPHRGTNPPRERSKGEGGTTPVAIERVRKLLKKGEITDRRCAKECVIA